MSAPNPVAAGHGYDQPYLCPPYLPGTYMVVPTPPSNISGSAAGNNDMTYINDPNVEGVVPPNPLANALAYSTNGQGAVYGWSVANQNWT